ncbi:MAG: hypothetical protein K8I00_09270 [Candidatus Omnitrophica bacterium]|nr:hypothetical protein [Candidatus Omnitrophota bacterium]
MVMFVFIGAARSVWAVDDEGWGLESKAGRFFYVTRGNAVWGHKFGYFKDPVDCSVDTLWLLFSAADQKVTEFEGKNVNIVFDVDGQEYKITVPLLSTGTIGYTYVMTFTNHQADAALLEALKEGKEVVIRISGPPELTALLDIPEDSFDLQGFKETRAAAADACREEAPKGWQAGPDVALK